LFYLAVAAESKTFLVCTQQFAILFLLPIHSVLAPITSHLLLSLISEQNKGAALAQQKDFSFQTYHG
jgi:hypothetical protein